MQPDPKAIAPSSHAILAREDDVLRLEDVFSILFPGADRSKVRKNHIRDAARLVHFHAIIRLDGRAGPRT